MEFFSVFFIEFPGGDVVVRKLMRVIGRVKSRKKLTKIIQGGGRKKIEKKLVKKIFLISR